jgi:hypothetical protein
MDRWARQVREHFPALNDAEVERRAQHLMRAHFLQLALRSSKVRSQKKNATASTTVAFMKEAVHDQRPPTSGV